MPTLLDRLLRQNLEEPEIPVCPNHKVDMRLRGKLGKPTRFFEQTESEYTLIYFCPVDGCDETANRVRVRTQIPVPGEAPERPSYSRPGEVDSL